MAGYQLPESTIMQVNARVPAGGSVLALVEAAAKGDEVLSDLDPEAVYMALSKGSTQYILNLSASLVLEMLLSGASPMAVACKLRDSFALPAAQAEQDVAEAIEALLAKGLLEEVE